MGRFFLICSVCFIFLTTNQGWAGETTEADWTAPAWRSALAPGWGQAYNGDEGKAWLMGGATWGLLGGVAVTYVEGEQALHDYDAAKTPQDATDRFNDADRWAQANEICYGLFATAYVITLFDAALGAKPPKPLKAPKRRRVSLDASPQGLQLAAAWQF
jgi:hypothetical protein